MYKIKDLSVEFCGLRFPNPIMLSSSPVSNTGEMIARAFERGFGGVVYKTVGVESIDVIHPSPRMAGYDYQNARLLGLQNVEQISDRPLKDNLADFRYLKGHFPDRILIASIMGFSQNEWKELAIAAECNGADALELNFSCPHMTIEGSGMKVGQAFHLVEKYTELVKRNVKIPVIAKMTSNITDINDPALYAKKGGADGISAINTVRGLSGIDPRDLAPRLNVFGVGAMSGYSGPAIKPIGLRFITELAQNKELGLPLSGIGGVETWIDALEYILCGASTVQITTGVIHYGYGIVEDILEGLSYYLEEKGYNSISELVGKALPNIQETDKFDLSRQGVADYDLDRCIGCGQCYTVCRDAGGQALGWNAQTRRPVVEETKCLSCMVCSFICPISDPPLITYREVKDKKKIIPACAG